MKDGARKSVKYRRILANISPPKKLKYFVKTVGVTMPTKARMVNKMAAQFRIWGFLVLVLKDLLPKTLTTLLTTTTVSALSASGTWFGKTSSWP